jgi:hypothetical protein
MRADDREDATKQPTVNKPPISVSTRRRWMRTHAPA